MKQRDVASVAALLRDVVRASEAILQVTAGMSFADYEIDDVRRWAVERQFTIVGEALGNAWKIDSTLDQKISAVREIVGFRNILVHGYGGVRHEIVWDIITNRVARLTNEVKALLATLPDPQTPA
ncbi:MAG TPA: HepT-like ribonuclease domain-containing protein [Thermoanaerobaculia bacterium]